MENQRYSFDIVIAYSIIISQYAEKSQITPACTLEWELNFWQQQQQKKLEYNKTSEEDFWKKNFEKGMRQNTEVSSSYIFAFINDSINASLLPSKLTIVDLVLIFKENWRLD